MSGNITGERLPTKMELQRIYGFTVFPDGKTDDCCGSTHYLIDSFTHRMFYHKQTYEEATREIEQMLNEMGLGK